VDGKRVGEFQRRNLLVTELTREVLDADPLVRDELDDQVLRIELFAVALVVAR
jgi:hypothetical protein